MNLTIDANVLISELARDEGFTTTLLTNGALINLYIAEYTLGEALHILPFKYADFVRRGLLTQIAADELHDAARDLIDLSCIPIPDGIYAQHETEARMRIPDDPDDWHTVALALQTGTSIWTLDQKHFFGCGMTVWKTSVLRSVLGASEP
jgi:predicted nucleic acid-binding protein